MALVSQDGQALTDRGRHLVHRYRRVYTTTLKTVAATLAFRNGGGVPMIDPSPAERIHDRAPAIASDASSSTRSGRTSTTASIRSSESSGTAWWSKPICSIDGHDRLAGVVAYRRKGSSEWLETPLSPAGGASDEGDAAAVQAPDDRWCGTLVVDAIGQWEYTVSAWVDAWASWTWSVRRKVAAGQDVEIDLRGGASLVAAAAERTSADAASDRAALRRVEQLLREGPDTGARIATALAAETAALMRAHADRAAATTYDPPLHVVVDPPRARFSSWYEMFPRSCGGGKTRTFRDAENRLPYIAEMGFDVVYLPPDPPHRSELSARAPTTASPPPPAIPEAPGPSARPRGTRSVIPSWGRWRFSALRARIAPARAGGGLDIAFQASPDHP